MLAKNVNDNARCLNKRGACEFFASKLAPTTIQCGSWPDSRSGRVHILTSIIRNFSSGCRIDTVAQ
ncbi:hypothetical protein DXU77_16415 [Pseudomonas lactis]|nr:hypothetical protein [Pseudomonas lactis]